MIVLQESSDGVPLIALEPMTPGTARALGNALSAIAPWARYTFSADALSNYLGGVESDAPRYALTVDGSTAGAVGIRTKWLRGPYLQFLGILPNYQSQGAGRLVLAWFEGCARAKQERNLWVAASDFNSAALRFYEQHGFHRAARLDGLVEDGVTEILLRKRLCIRK
jgi:ribosomal protein S18 acetylase RimI-like enzyme